MEVPSNSIVVGRHFSSAAPFDFGNDRSSLYGAARSVTLFSREDEVLRPDSRSGGARLLDLADGPYWFSAAERVDACKPVMLKYAMDSSASEAVGNHEKNPCGLGP